ncbi:hypothetical protein B0A48_17921 [Cryoendolithus antarcticus]|uniref:Uncharacterized protein n=1 Tax=Cryoendolithus antarcticus TaxID=1507870 RepID=A0A1V8S9U0_9PEZI|nr:hypothetical protein B0A48_17921 [Cryoendolithus antarcticus]
MDDYASSSYRSSRQGFDEQYELLPSLKRSVLEARLDKYRRAYHVLKEQLHLNTVVLPSARAQVPTAPTTGPRHGYPKTYENREQIASTKSISQPPYNEYPLMPQRYNDFATEKNRPGRKADPGPLRAIYNDTDRSAFDVAYHNRKLGDHDRNFEKAVYQPRSSGYSASAALEAKG